MKSTRIHLQWNPASFTRRFRTGVSLHSHTLYSRESLAFIYQAAKYMPVLAAAIRHGERAYREAHGEDMDLTRGWWTPPLGAHDAWLAEKLQVENLGMKPLVSLTDHDQIEAPVSLQVLKECSDVPISTEWTVPFRGTFFHLGIHNLPAASARALHGEMEDYRFRPEPARLEELLRSLSQIPEVLVVFNHPLWDEKGIGPARHRDAVDAFMRLHGETVHAFEVNGLRPWRENRALLDLGERFEKPAISGGDRHVFEPNAVLNVTNATSFDEFAEEVRSGVSDVLILRHYREAHALRIMHNMIDVLRTCDRHANGWRLWSDRVFYQSGDGTVRSLTDWFGKRTPAAVSLFVGALHLASAPQIRRMLSGAFAVAEKVVL